MTDELRMTVLWPLTYSGGAEPYDLRFSSLITSGFSCSIIATISKAIVDTPNIIILIKEK